MEFSSLTSFNLSNFNIENATNMEHMFEGCDNLVNINTENERLKDELTNKNNE